MTIAGKMNLSLIVVVNGDAIVEYDRNKELPRAQQEYLEKMDRAMDAGITLGEETIDEPNVTERAAFVANNLIEAVWSDDEPMIAATCAYLANRLPALLQVKAEEESEGFKVDLVFDQEYSPEVRVSLN